MYMSPYHRMSQIEWLASLNPTEHEFKNGHLRKTYVFVC